MKKHYILLLLFVIFFPITTGEVGFSHWFSDLILPCIKGAFLGKNKAKHLFFDQITYGGSPNAVVNTPIALPPCWSALTITVTLPLIYAFSHRISKKAATSLTTRWLKNNSTLFLVQALLQKAGSDFIGNALLYCYKCMLFSTLSFAHNTMASNEDRSFAKKSILKKFIGIQPMIKNLILSPSELAPSELAPSELAVQGGTYDTPFIIHPLSVGKNIFQLYKLIAMLPTIAVPNPMRDALLMKLKKKILPNFEDPMVSIIKFETALLRLSYQLPKPLSSDPSPISVLQEKESRITTLLKSMYPNALYAFIALVKEHQFIPSKKAIKNMVRMKKKHYLVEIRDAMVTMQSIIFFFIPVQAPTNPLMEYIIDNKEEVLYDNNAQCYEENINPGAASPFYDHVLFEFLHRIVEENTKKYFIDPSHYHGMFLPCFKNFYVIRLFIELSKEDAITFDQVAGRYYWKKNLSSPIAITQNNFDTLLDYAKGYEKIAQCTTNTNFFHFLVTLANKTHDSLFPKKEFTLKGFIETMFGEAPFEAFCNNNNNSKSYDQRDRNITITSYRDDNHYLWNRIQLHTLNQNFADNYFTYYDSTQRIHYYNEKIKKLHNLISFEEFSVKNNENALQFYEAFDKVFENKLDDHQFKDKFLYDNHFSSYPERKDLLPPSITNIDLFKGTYTRIHYDELTNERTLEENIPFPPQ